MYNEDKMLDMLGKLVEGQMKIEQDVTDLKHDVTNLKHDVTDLKQEVTSSKDILLRMEHNHGLKLQMLLDAHDANLKSHGEMNKRITRLEADVAKLKLAE